MKTAIFVLTLGISFFVLPSAFVVARTPVEKVMSQQKHVIANRGVQQTLKIQAPDDRHGDMIYIAVGEDRQPQAERTAWTEHSGVGNNRGIHDCLDPGY